MLSFHISDTSAPQSGKSAPIQKGLIPHLQNENVDICGEGLGFGTPILQYRRDFYFPGSASICHKDNDGSDLWAKQFIFNLIERKQHDPLTSIDTFSWVLPRLHNRIYKTKNGRQLLKLVALLNQWTFQARGKQSAPQYFIPVKSQGECQCQFLVRLKKRQIDVQVSFDTIVRNHLQFIYIANELGGQYFTQYWDSSGLYLQDNQIEPWAKITGHWAIFYAPALKFGFRVEIPKGINAFRGREVFEAHDIFWSGILLRFPKSTITCNYQIQYGAFQQIQETQPR